MKYIRKTGKKLLSREAYVFDQGIGATRFSITDDVKIETRNEIRNCED